MLGSPGKFSTRARSHPLVMVSGWPSALNLRGADNEQKRIQEEERSGNVVGESGLGQIWPERFQNFYRLTFSEVTFGLRCYRKGESIRG